MRSGLYFPYLPPVWLLVVSIAALAAIVLLLYRWVESVAPARSVRTLAALRLAVIALILFCICHPIARTFFAEEASSLVAVVVDTSKSMAIGDARDELSRLDFLKRHLAGPAANFLAELSRNFRVRLYSLSDEIRPVATTDDLEAEGKRTALAKCLAELRSGVADETLSGVVLCSDGAENAYGSALNAAFQFREQGAPLYTVAVGGDVPTKDIELCSLSVHRVVTIDTKVTVTAAVQSRGYEGVTVPLLLTRDGKTVKTKHVKLAEGLQKLTLTFVPKEVGLLKYHLEVPHQDGELIAENNQQGFGVDASRHTLKVLYMEGTQYKMEDRKKWEIQYLIEALEEDKDVQVTALFRDDVEAGRKIGLACVDDPENGYPREKRKLYEYDVVICSDIDIEKFTKKQVEMTVDFVADHGGGYVMIGGYTAFGTGGYDESPVDKMLPVDMRGRDDGYTEDQNQKFQWQLTPDGWAHPIMRIDPDPDKNKEIWKKCPTFNGFNHVIRGKPAATVLAVHPTRKTLHGPMVMLAVQQYGRGRTMAFVPDTTAGWGQQFEAKWGEEGDERNQNRYYRIFWQNAIRWLAAYQLKVPNKMVLLRTVSSQFAPGDRANVYADVLDSNYDPTTEATVTATLRSPSGAESELRLEPDFEKEGTYFVEFPVDEEGEYEIRAKSSIGDDLTGEDSAVIFCREANVEFRAYQPNTELLEMLAQKTAGEHVAASDLAALPEKIVQATHQSEAYSARSFWDNLHLYLLILALLAVEWFWRRRVGLP